VKTLTVATGGDRVAANVKGAVVIRDLSLPDERLALGASHVDLFDAVANVGGVKLRAERLTVSGTTDLRVADRTTAASLSVSGARLTARQGDTAFAADVEAHATGSAGWGSGPGRAELSAGTALFTHVVLEGKGPLRIETSRLALDTTRLLVHDGRVWGTASIDLQRAEVSDLRHIGGAVPLPTGLAVDGGRASLSLRLAVTLPSGSASGDGELIARDLELRAGSRPMTGALSLTLRARGSADATDLSGSALTFESSGDPSNHAADGWWARASLAGGGFSMPPLRFHGKLHAQARDGAPIESMLSASTPLPRWVAGVAPFRGLEADFELRAARSSLEIRFLTARGGPDLAELEYAAHPDAEWVLLVEAGTIHAGFHREGGATHFVLFGARPWFERIAAQIRDRESGY
jgi:hypothetical protein